MKFDLKTHRAALLGFAIITAWIAGLGRYWDHPDTAWWQYAGLGSVAYIFVMAFILWLIVLPLRPSNWSYFGVLVFVGLTSPLAWLYAIPIERSLNPTTATNVNLVFLGIVAVWRVALFAAFLWRAAKLRYLRWLMGILAPLVLVMMILTLFNLQHVTFEVMAGIDRPDLTPPQTVAEPDASSGVIVVLGVIALWSFKYIFFGYALAIAWVNRGLLQSRG